MLFLIIIPIFVGIIYYYWKWKGEYWSRRHVNGPKPIPIVGNLLNYLLMKEHYGIVYDRIYREYKNARYIGVYKLMNQPAILVRDLDLVKDILATNFHNFENNDFILDENIDPLLSKDPFAATGHIWKNGRTHLTPLFTAGKIKSIFPLISDVCNKFVKHVEQQPNNIEAKTLCSKYTLGVISSVGFGIETEIFKNQESEIKKMTDKLFVPDKWSMIKTTSVMFMPFLSKLFQMPFIPKELDQWTRDVISNIVHHRSTEKEKRADFLQTLLDMRSKTDINDELLYGYCLSILVEAFETSSSLMGYALYELALNHDIQEICANEIDKMFKKYNGKLTDDGIQELQFLDGLMYETLRLYAPMVAMTKICTKQCKLPPQYPESKLSIIVETGTPILIPCYSIHHDAAHFPNPFEFDPNRFIGENRKNIKKYSYLAFGEGQRMCIGQRFGIAQSKAGIASLLAHFKVKLIPKTEIPLKISAKSFVLSCEEGIWIEFEKR